MNPTSTKLGYWARIALVLVATVAALPMLPARAVGTFTVNLTEDQDDFDLGDGVCDAAQFAAGRQCTLRAAIQQANTGADRDTIAFAIPGPGLKSLRPVFELPAITQPLLIDGYTQPGAKRNTLATGGINAVPRIELDGANAGSAAGLTIDAPNVTIRGLVVNRFDNAGITVDEPRGRNARIEGCFIGTNAAGTAALGNDDGVELDGDNATIGGTTPAARNLISGNDSEGIDAFSAGNLIQGNLIGTDKTGAGALGNGLSGIELLDPDNTVGGNGPAAENVVAFNGDGGVEVQGTDSINNRVLRNSIFANTGEGIDLGGDGPTPNDSGDGDGVGDDNNLQNKPVLTVATTSGGTTTIKGQLNSTRNAVFVVRVFSNPTGGEGKVFRGQFNVATGPDGTAAFTFSPAPAVPKGQTVTATATSDDGDTSEFSPARLVA